MGSHDVGHIGQWLSAGLSIKSSNNGESPQWTLHLVVVGTVVGTQQFPNEMDPTLFLVGWNYWWQTQRPLGNLDHTVISNDWHHLEQDIFWFYSISISTVCINTGSSITHVCFSKGILPCFARFFTPRQIPPKWRTQAHGFLGLLA